jgi:hypothetical protein
MPLLHRECLESEDLLRRQEACEEIFCPHPCVSVVRSEPAEIPSASRHEEDRSRSLTVTIAAWKNPRGHQKASAELMTHPSVQA